MKILLYFEDIKLLSHSGIGRAYDHQRKALTSAGIDYTTDPSAEDYDILHINTYGINSASLIRKARKLKRKVIYHAHSTEEDFRNSFIFSNKIAPLFRRHLVHLYQQADVLITPTVYARGLLVNYGLKQPVYVLSNGVDIDQYRKDNNKAEVFRKYFSLKPEDKVIIGAGMLFQRKGIQDFIEVARQLPAYKFIWFGSTPGLLIPAKNRAARENHPRNVFFPGYVKGEIMEGAYSGASCFFFPSYEETEGIVVLEALAAGIPLVIRDIDVYRDWLTNGIDCYKGKDNRQFAELITGLIENRLPSIVEEEHKRAEERSIAKTGIQLRKIYEEVLAH